MKVRDLDGNEHEWKIPDKVAKGNDRKTSNLHSIAKMLLRKRYPNVAFYEEVPIPVAKKKKLFLDFYIPTFNLAIEVNGKQHYEFTAAFHTTKANFLRSKVNDTIKAAWCEDNDIELIVLKYNEVDEWDKQI